MSKQQVETKANELAKQVVPEQFFNSFLALSLADKLVGIATFAHLSNDSETRDLALAMAKEME